MAATNRLRYDSLLCGVLPPKLSTFMNDSTTDINLSGPLKHSGTVAVPDIADPDYLPLVIGPDTANMEIVWLTAYNVGNADGTILRGQEGTAAIPHGVNTPVVHGPTVADIGSGAVVDWANVDLTGVEGDDVISLIVEVGGIYISINNDGDTINIATNNAVIRLYGNGDIQISGSGIGFFGGAAVAQPTGVAVDAAAIHAALVSLGLITA